MKWLFLQFLRIFAKIFRVFFSLLGGAFLILVPILLVIWLGFHYEADDVVDGVKSGAAAGAFSILMVGVLRRIELWADAKIKTEFPDKTAGRGPLTGIVILLLVLGGVGWFSSAAPRAVQPTVSNADDYEQTEDMSAPEEMLEDEPLDQDSGFVFPNSDTEWIGRGEIESLSDRDLTYAINEIYARHGYLFRDRQIREYYEQFRWYCGEVPSDEFSTECFNQIESDNWNLLVSERDKRRAPG